MISKKGVLMSLQNEIDNPTRRVLLVEDEALVAMVAADSLNELGYDVVEVGTARAALDYERTSLRAAIDSLGLPEQPPAGRALRAES
jgi:DNA-binding response OmpR family regulator